MQKNLFSAAVRRIEIFIGKVTEYLKYKKFLDDDEEERVLIDIEKKQKKRCWRRKKSLSE